MQSVRITNSVTEQQKRPTDKEYQDIKLPITNGEDAVTTLLTAAPIMPSESTEKQKQ